jgi:F0F1-type ATP synthase assembly protein I
MNDNTAPELVIKTRKVIGLQIAIGALVAVFFYFTYTPWHGLSVLYGAMISVLSSWWLSRGVSSAGAHAGQGRKGEAILYVGAALRFIMVLALFAIGLAVIKLAAVATVVGFALSQLAFVIAGNLRGQRD